MKTIVADTNLFISHLAGDENADYADIILEEAEKGKLKIYKSSTMIDDLVTAYRSQGYTKANHRNPPRPPSRNLRTSPANRDRSHRGHENLQRTPRTKKNSTTSTPLL